MKINNNLFLCSIFFLSDPLHEKSPLKAALTPKAKPPTKRNLQVLLLKKNFFVSQNKWHAYRVIDKEILLALIEFKLNFCLEGGGFE